jgi:hypothetical protein
MNISKIEVLDVLLHSKNKWIKAKEIAKQLKQPDTASVNRISNVLYRLRRYPGIERRSNSHAYQYHFCGSITGYPTKENAFSKTKAKKSDGFEDYNIIDLLTQPAEAFCEECQKFCDVSFIAEKNGCKAYLCQKHGLALINISLRGTGGLSNEH